jgi:glycosyltransferase involved in cell wall biosynthesis
MQIVKTHTPIISVIMPVRNMELFVLEATNSILEQSFTDFELIIVDDASTDDTRSVLNEIKDSRIIRINNPKQSGNYKCRNQGLCIAKGKYICVMDADDIAHSERLLKQYRFMEFNPQYLASGTDIELFGQNFSPKLFQRLRNEHELKVQLLRDNVCTHPTLIIRREVFEQHQIRYNEEYYYAADYNLMVDISRIGAITNRTEPLLRYRIHPGQITAEKSKEQLMYANQIKLKQLYNLRLRPSIDEIIVHLSLMNDFSIPEEKWLSAEKWCNKLLAKNQRIKLFDSEFLYQFLEERMIISLRNKNINEVI